MSDQPPIIPNNAEIDAALKEFEASKYNPEQTTQTAASQTIVPPAIINPVVKTTAAPKLNNDEYGVSFDTDNFKEVSAQAVSAYEDKATSGMVKLVKKLSMGAIKNDRQAQWVLLGVVVVAVSISLYLVFGVLTTTSVNKKKIDSVGTGQAIAPLQ